MRARKTRGAPLAMLGIGLMLSGCESLHLYEGEKRSQKELALIVGDMRISGALPVSIAIRRVDEEALGIRYRGAYVLPGEHDLLIDCTVTESKRTSRHHLTVDVDAGVKYRLTATMTPGNQSCRDVQLVGGY